MEIENGLPSDIILSLFTDADWELFNEETVLVAGIYTEHIYENCWEFKKCFHENMKKNLSQKSPGDHKITEFPDKHV